MRGKRGVCRVITIALVFVSIAMLTGCSRQASSKIKITQSSTPVIEKTAEATATKAEKPNTTEEDKKNTEPSPTPGVIKPADYVKALEKTYGVKLPESAQVLSFRNFIYEEMEEHLQAKVVIPTNEVETFVKGITVYLENVTQENRVLLDEPGTIGNRYVPDWWDLDLDDITIRSREYYSMERKLNETYVTATTGCREIMITKDFDGKTYIYFA